MKRLHVLWISACINCMQGSWHPGESRSRPYIHVQRLPCPQHIYAWSELSGHGQLGSLPPRLPRCRPHTFSFLSVASSLTQFMLPDLTKLFGTLAMWIGQLLLMYLDFKCFVGDSLELSLLESNLYHSHHQCEQDKTVLACRVVWIHHQTVTAVLTGFCISELLGPFCRLPAASPGGG